MGRDPLTAGRPRLDCHDAFLYRYDSSHDGCEQTGGYRSNLSVMEAVLLSVGVTLLVALVFDEALERWGEPAIVGEIAAGIVLGPFAL